MSVKKQFLQEIYKQLGETDDANIRASGLPIPPDVVELAWLLRSCGFRVCKVDLLPVALSLPPASKSCRVRLTCVQTGLSVTLESEGACRCPEAATCGDDSVSMWTEESQTSSFSQENSKSEQAGSCLLPEVPAAVAELVSVAVASALKLMQEVTAKKVENIGSLRPPRPPQPSRSVESLLQLSAEPGALGSEAMKSRSLEDMGRTKDPGQSISAISSTSDSEGKLVSDQAKDTIRGDTPTCSAEGIPRPRRQSSTLANYATFKKCLSDNNVHTANAATSSKKLPETSRKQQKVVYGDTPFTKMPGLVVPPRPVALAAVSKTAHRETGHQRTPRPPPPRRLKGPAPLPRVATASPKVSSLLPTPHPGKGIGAIPTKHTPRSRGFLCPPISTLSSASGPKSLPFQQSSTNPRKTGISKAFLRSPFTQSPKPDGCSSITPSGIRAPAKTVSRLLKPIQRQTTF